MAVVTDDARTVMFLHGLGASPSSWDAQLTALPPGFTGFAPQIPGITGAAHTPFTVQGAARALVGELDARHLGSVHLCGLSLGAMVATQLALDHPDRVASLVLSGSQVRPNPVLMAVQRNVIRLLPEQVAAGMGLTKSDWLAVLRSISRVDTVPRLREIHVPTLVLRGSRDVANLPAARRLADGVPGARLQVVPGAGHPWNEQDPERFSATLSAFYGQLDDVRSTTPDD